MSAANDKEATPLLEEGKAAPTTAASGKIQSRARLAYVVGIACLVAAVASSVFFLCSTTLEPLKSLTRVEERPTQVAI